MLKNKGAEVVVRYNGMEKVVPANGLLDVRDFDISLGQMTPAKELTSKVEKHILKKYAGCFEVTAHTENVQIDAQYKKEIEDLKAQVEKLEKELAAEKKISALSSRKVSEMAEEINGFGEKEAGYKKQISTLKAKIKDDAEENDAHVARIMGGKK